MRNHTGCAYEVSADLPVERRSKRTDHRRQLVLLAEGAISGILACSILIWILTARNRIALLELTLLALVSLLAWFRPRLGLALLRPVDRFLKWGARRNLTAILVPGFLALALRAAFLPWIPIPSPRIHDEFSHLLASDTFSSGRLSNPTHPLWKHFESFHIDQKPTYMSMYPPAQGVVLAVGKVLFGHPWFGIWLSAGIMCAALSWALRGWLPPRWAFLGGLVAALRWGTLSYFANSYWGGAIAATGGALVVGAWPRLRASQRPRDAALLAAGFAILACSRPCEGFILSVAVTTALLVSFCKNATVRNPPALARCLMPIALAVIVSSALLTYYNARVFGGPFVLPYEVNRATYAAAPVFVWQPLAAEPHYNHAELREFYLGWELADYRLARTLPGYLMLLGCKAALAWGFYVGPLFTPALVVFPFMLRDKKVRGLWFAGAAVLICLLLQVFFQPHYAAPASVLVLALLVHGLRRLQLWRRGDKSGLFLTRAIPVTAFVVCLCVGFAPQLWGEARPASAWYFFTPGETSRDRIIARLRTLPGQHVVIVRYPKPYKHYDDWIYNDADIDRSNIVWAREMAPAENQALLRYFRTRRAWLLDASSDPPRLTEYVVTLRK